MKKIDLLPFSSFKLVVSDSPNHTSYVTNLDSRNFTFLNLARASFLWLVLKWHTVSRLRAWMGGGVGRMGGHMAMSQH
jgi:hypothetical protein